MSSSTVGRPYVALALLLGLGAASVELMVVSSSGGSQWRLLTDLSQIRIGDGRLFRSYNSPLDPDQSRKALIDASLELLKKPDSAFRLRMQSLLDMNAGNLRAAGDSLRQLVETDLFDAEALNDLGVVYMALGKEGAANYFRAAQLFERSRRLTPHASAPNFNVAVVYRKLQLDELADQRQREYSGLETLGGVMNHVESESKLLESIHDALVNKDPNLASELVKANLPSCRYVALQTVLNPGDDATLDDASKFILEYFKDARKDQTIAAILAPLNDPNHQRVVSARKLVSRGIESYRHTQFEEASHLYDMAEAALIGVNSRFDDLWIKLNRADTDIRLGQTTNAQQLLASVIAESRARQYTWLLGMALTARSADPTITSDNERQLQTLQEAVDLLVSIDAHREAARALNYLAVAYLLAGDFETSMNIAYRTLSFTPKSDHLRRAQLFLMLGTEVHRLGLPEYASPLAEKALLEANSASNPTLVSFVTSNLALFHALSGNASLANGYFQAAKKSNSEIKTLRERELSDLDLNLLCARIRTAGGNLSEVENCLRQNMHILRRLPGRLPYYLVQTLLQLGETHALQRQFDQARQDFQDAADVLENDDVYLAAGGLRMAFENERRSLYERAIAFEYDHGGKDKAWEYTQRYRSKLFLEFLGRLNPGVEAIRGVAIDRSKVQQLIPPNVQVVEYVVLQDRLLIWLVSNKSFVTTTVPVTRAELERRVADFLKRTQDKGTNKFQQQAQDLHRLLIEPIESQLDLNSTLAIVPDQALHRLNFPSLYSQSKKSYLVERHTLLESPSLTSLLSGEASTPSRDNAVGFGAQTDDTNATAELTSLQKYYSGIKSFNGPAALKTAFLSSLSSTGVLHYAGHSQDASDPLRSAILLDGNREGPNSVTAVDITKVRMPPNSVVILASCDSSVGNSRDGVGMRGLTSAFLISGAGSVVGSLWLVEAKSTSQLVLAFHKGFAQDKLSVAEALRKAQLGFIAEGKHPYYWSGFVVTGNVSALR